MLTSRTGVADYKNTGEEHEWKDGEANKTKIMNVTLLLSSSFERAETECIWTFELYVSEVASLHLALNQHNFVCDNWSVKDV